MVDEDQLSGSSQGNQSTTNQTSSGANNQSQQNSLPPENDRSTMENNENRSSRSSLHGEDGTRANHVAKITLRKIALILKTPEEQRGAHFFDRVERVLQEIDRDLAHTGTDPEDATQLMRHWGAFHSILNAAYARSQSHNEEHESSSSDTETNQPTGRRPTAKDMEPFDGRATSWSTFVTLFKEIILGAKLGSETLKLKLLADLVPQHRELIKSHTNCADAIAVISPQYSSSAALWSDLLLDLQRVPALTDKSGVEAWQILESAILRAQRCISSTDQALLFQAHVLLKNKLGPLWKQYNFAKDNKTLDDLLKIVALQIDGLRTAELEKVFMPQAAHANVPTANKFTQPKLRHTHYPAQLAITAATVQQPHASSYQVEPCYFCGQHHMRIRCHLDRVQRQRALEQGRRCLKCLQPEEGHQCAGTGCRRCQSALHTLICPCPQSSSDSSRPTMEPRNPPPPPPNGGARYGNSAPPSGGASGAPTANGNRQQSQSTVPHAPVSGQAMSRAVAYAISINEHVSTAVEEPPEITSAVSNSSAVFLPTLKLYTINPDTSLALTVRTLLDEASTTSFLSESVAAQLGLEKKPVKPFTVGAFGGLAKLRIEWEASLVIQSLADRNVRSTINVYVMSGILVGQLPAATPEFLAQANNYGVQLTDYSINTDYFPIDLLIGQDLYNDNFLLPLQRSYKFQPGMAFVNSRFGWTLQGAVGGRRPRNLFVNCAYMSTGPDSDQAKAIAFSSPSELMDVSSPLVRSSPGLKITRALRAFLVSKRRLYGNVPPRYLSTFLVPSLIQLIEQARQAMQASARSISDSPKSVPILKLVDQTNGSLSDLVLSQASLKSVPIWSILKGSPSNKGGRSHNSHFSSSGPVLGAPRVFRSPGVQSRLRTFPRRSRRLLLVRARSCTISSLPFGLPPRSLLSGEQLICSHQVRSRASARRTSLSGASASSPMGLAIPENTFPPKAPVAVEAGAMLAALKSVPRLAKPSAESEYWLFGAASSDGYGVTIYLFDCATQRAELLLSRGPIAAKKKTIPQLELMAAVLLVETFELVRQSFPDAPARLRYFTDSQVTWHRIRSDPSKHEAFVATRITRLLEFSSPDNWFYIPSEFNPADVVSRGCSLRILRFQQLWFNGPPLSVILNSERQTKSLIEARVHSIYPLLTVDGNELMKRIVNTMSHSTLKWFFHRMMAHVNRYVNLPQRYNLANGIEVSFSLLVDVVRWKWIQAIVLADELAAIAAGQPLPASSPLKGLPLRKGEFGLLRLDRRLEHSDLPYDVKFPLVLLDSPAVRHYIHHIHVSHACHGGSHVTEDYLKQNIFIPNCARVVQNVVYSCITCRHYRTGKAFSVPMAPLPLERVTRGYAFEAVGIDTAGPIRNDLGRYTEYYTLIFVCLKSRAVHPEVFDSREPTALMRAFKRFAGRYGTPGTVLSDNALGLKKLNVTPTRAIHHLIPIERSVAGEDVVERVHH